MIPFPLRLVLFLLHEAIGIHLCVKIISIAFPILKHFLRHGSWPHVHVSVSGGKIMVDLPMKGNG